MVARVGVGGIEVGVGMGVGGHSREAPGFLKK